MGRKLLKIFLWIFAVQIIGFIIGTAISKKMTRGDESSDEFQVAAILGGKQFHSNAHHLKSGAVLATMGGVDLDLRDATLESGGATLDVKARMGGVQIVVSEDWAVEVDSTVTAGEVEVKVTPPEDLPDDAPRLHIDADARMGGVLVTNKTS